MNLTFWTLFISVSCSVILIVIRKVNHVVWKRILEKKDKIEAKTGQNQEQTESMEKSKVKPDKAKAKSKPKRHQVKESAHYGYNCLPKVPIIPDPEPFNNQTIDELPQTLPSFDPTCYSENGNSFTYDSTSNLVHDSPNDFNPPSDDQSFYDDDIPKKIYSNPLFDEEIISIKIDPHHFNAESDLIEYLLNYDFSIISSSSKVDSLLDEFAGELTLLKSIPQGINETVYDPEKETRLIKRLLYDNSSPRPPKEFVFENYNVAIESFSPFPIPVKDSDSFMEEIDLSFTPDDPMLPGIEEDDYDSKRDILILE
nr:hypothetical protein [Tanacetum cinerariifolium]